jgi:hypothetical protein
MASASVITRKELTSDITYDNLRFIKILDLFIKPIADKDIPNIEYSKEVIDIINSQRNEISDFLSSLGGMGCLSNCLGKYKASGQIDDDYISTYSIPRGDAQHIIGNIVDEKELSDCGKYYFQNILSATVIPQALISTPIKNICHDLRDYNDENYIKYLVLSYYFFKNYIKKSLYQQQPRIKAHRV